MVIQYEIIGIYDTLHYMTNTLEFGCVKNGGRAHNPPNGQ